jgi:hypothetical protein
MDEEQCAREQQCSRHTEDQPAVAASSGIADNEYGGQAAERSSDNSSDEKTGGAHYCDDHSHNDLLTVAAESQEACWSSRDGDQGN